MLHGKILKQDLNVNGNLKARNVIGGVLLVESEFEIKEEKVKKQFEKY